jgi:hypothetical protein
MVTMHAVRGYRVDGKPQAPAHICGTVASPEAWTILNKMSSYTLQPVGFVRSTIKGREDAPRQGPEGASAEAIV